MSKKNYLIVLKVGVILALLSVFMLYKNLLFPYITSKQIYFNILIEVLFIIWVIFLFKFPDCIPWKKQKNLEITETEEKNQKKNKKTILNHLNNFSWISIGLIFFIISMLASLFTTVDFNLSFWGDVERMLGIFHIIHFIIFYFIIITAFRTWNDWRVLFISSVSIAVLVSFYGLSMLDVARYSTIGNTAYVSGYLIFNIYFCLLLFFKDKVGDWKWLYLLPLTVLLPYFNMQTTSGAFVGLGFSLMVMLFLYGVLNKNKKIRKYTLASLMIMVISIVLIFTNLNSNFVKNTPVIRMARSITFQKGTFQTRLISWKAGLKDFKEHPILGVGHGNYAYIFDKHFDPKFYDFARSETYFDRAHNNLIDIISTTGLFGLLAYLSIFIATAFYLISRFRKNIINIHDFVLVSALIVAYFVQNLAIFDSLVTYTGIMIVLGYVFWLCNLNTINKDNLEIPEKKITTNSYLNNKSLIFILGILLGTGFVIYQFNIKPLKMLTTTIDGQIAFQRGGLELATEVYKDALSYDTVLDRDSRSTYINSLMSNFNSLNTLKKEKAQEILDYGIKLAQENISYNPQDSLMQMTYAQLLFNSARFYYDDQEKFAYYTQKSLEHINKAINASPGRSPVYIIKSRFLQALGKNDQATQTLKYASNLNENYYEVICALGKMYFSLNNNIEGMKEIDRCIAKGGANQLDSVNFIKSLISYYEQINDQEKVIKLYARLATVESTKAEAWIKLALLYRENGEIEKAKNAAKKAAEIDASLSKSVDEFIENLDKK